MGVGCTDIASFNSPSKESDIVRIDGVDTIRIHVAAVELSGTAVVHVYIAEFYTLATQDCRRPPNEASELLVGWRFPASRYRRGKFGPNAKGAMLLTFAIG